MGKSVQRSYTNEDIRRAAAHYVIHGTIKSVVESTGIPQATVSTWKAKNEYWLEVIDQIRSEKEDEIRAGYSKIVTLGLQNQIDRLENGDVVIDKNGEMIRKPISYRDLATGTGIANDKYRVSLNLPNTISNTSSSLETIANKLKELELRENEKVIQGEVIEEGGGGK